MKTARDVLQGMSMIVAKKGMDKKLSRKYPRVSYRDIVVGGEVLMYLERDYGKLGVPLHNMNNGLKMLTIDYGDHNLNRLYEQGQYITC